MESSDSTNMFTPMVSQTWRAFEISIEAEVFFKNLQKKNKEFLNKTSQVEEAAKKAKANADAAKKQQAEESLKLASTLAKIENLKNKSICLRVK